jgi:endonuclease/exonuclease/phosphatase (EEP) superfamily protein YafD
VALCAIAAVAVAIGFHWDAASTWWIEFLRYLPFPVFLMPAAAAAIASLALGAIWRLLAAGTVALVLTAVMGLELHVGDEGGDALRVMTFNAKLHLARVKPEGYARIGSEIASHDPDVLVMQDAHLGATPDLPPPIRAALRGHSIHRSGQYLVASRYPLRDCRDGDLSYGGEPQHYVRCSLLAHGVQIDLVTVHLASPRRGLNATRHEGLDGLDDWQVNFRDRMVQVGRLVSALAGPPRPLIVAGDLNAPEHSPVVRSLLRAGLRDAFASAGRGFGYTHGHALRPRFSFLRIDHILVSGTIGVRRSFVGGSDASEHRPVIADLLLRRQ